MSETSEHSSTRTWDGAASPSAGQLADRFEEAWRASPDRKPKPNLRDFLPKTKAERPSCLLALLRVELALRYEAGESPQVETYHDEYAELDEDGLVALIYEDFCLREEAGDAPAPVEYDERFPDLTGRLKRVFDIHDLVGSEQSLGLASLSNPKVVFPEVGQTIAGFHLRDELGRGAFARVFLAEERQLADRPVALKVARTGSREPQTLARLQHTHIVPVHSYRTDPATGLHLLCMPYFGRITLERLLAEPALRTARTGGDLLSVLNRLDPSGISPESVPSRPALAKLPFDRVLAWWGARMAEALAHAHDRGVMHRDVKPSNVLMTPDGLPMLLDFNLAREPADGLRTEEEAGSLGGTLAYMAPEQLDAIAAGRDDKVDGRADIYSLGVLLFEALTGARPFPPPSSAASVADAIRRAAERRRGEVPSIRDTHPEIPVALELVVLRCLAADPDKRHPDAASLAADLQAVADEQPLPFTKEPWGSRARRCVSRHRFGLSLTVPLMICGSLLVNSARQAQEDQSRLVRRVDAFVAEGDRFLEQGRVETALAKFDDALAILSDQPFRHAQPVLVDAFQRTSARRLRLKFDWETERNVERFSQGAERIRGLLIDEASVDSSKAGDEIDALIEPYLPIADAPGWSRRSLPEPLAGRVGARLETDLLELLARRVLLLRPKNPADQERAIALCEAGERMSRDKAAWKALQRWMSRGERGLIPGEGLVDSESVEPLTRALVYQVQGNLDEAIRQLRTAIRRSSGDFWLFRQNAVLLARSGRPAEAIVELGIALEVRPGDRLTQEARTRLDRALAESKEGRPGKQTPLEASQPSGSDRR